MVEFEIGFNHFYAFLLPLKYPSLLIPLTDKGQTFIITIKLHESIKNIEF